MHAHTYIYTIAILTNRLGLLEPALEILEHSSLAWKCKGSNDILSYMETHPDEMSAFPGKWK